MTTIQPEKKKKGRKRTGFLILIIILIGTWVFLHKNENTEAYEAVQAFKQQHPSLNIPEEFDLKKDKEWDSGVIEYRVKSSEQDYMVYIQDGKVTKVFLRSPRQQLYPAVTVQEPNKSVQTNVETPVKPPKQQEMGKVEYTITISQLVKDAITNTNDINVYIESPDLSQEGVQELSTLVNESIGLYEQAKQIVPPVEWQALHEDLLGMWETYIVGEEGLVEATKYAWNATESERKQALEVLKEKGEVAGQYGLEFGDLLLEFLGEITGFSN